MGFISSLINGARDERMQSRNLQFRSHENNADRKLEKYKIDSYYDFAKSEQRSSERKFNTMQTTFNKIFDKLSPMLSNLAQPVPDFFSSLGKGVSSSSESSNKLCAGVISKPFTPQTLREMIF